jgi:hypothetical protein
MRSNFGMPPGQSILTPKERRSGSLVTAAAILGVVGTVACGGVYSQIVGNGEPTNGSFALAAATEPPFEAPIAVPDRTGRATADSTLRRDVAVARIVGPSTTEIDSPTQPLLLARAVADAPPSVASPVESTKAAEDQSDFSSPSPEEKPRPAKKKSARGDVYRSAKNGGWNAAPWGALFGGFDGGPRLFGHRTHLAHRGPFPW